MRKIVPFTLALFCALGVGAETLVFDAPFQGVSTDPCRDTTRPSTIFCSDGTVDGSGNLLDLSGENLIPYSDQVDNWSAAVNVTVTSDAMRDPDNLYRADIINEGNAVGTNFRVSIINLMAAGTKYTSTFALKPLNRSWVMIGWETLSIYAYVDLKNKIVGNTVGSPTVELRDLPGGWVEVSLTNVALNNGGIYLFVAEANGDNTFDGLSQPSIAIARATLYKREGQWATKRSPYIRTSGVAKPRHDVAPNRSYALQTEIYDFDTPGTACVSDMGKRVDVESNTPPGLVVYDPTSGIEPFIIKPAADTCVVTYKGIVSVQDWTEYPRNVFETCTLTGGTEPDGWTITEVAGGGAADGACDATTMADGAKSFKLSTTAAGSSVEALGTCRTDRAGDSTTFVSAYAKKISGTSAAYIGIRTYTDAACSVGGADTWLTNAAGDDLSTDWTYYSDVVDLTGKGSYQFKLYSAGSASVWNADTVSIIDSNSKPTGHVLCDSASPCTSTDYVLYTNIADGNPLTYGAWEFYGIWETPYDDTTFGDNEHYLFYSKATLFTNNLPNIKIDPTLPGPRCTSHAGIDGATNSIRNYSTDGWTADTQHEITCVYKPDEQYGVLNFWVDGTRYYNLSYNGSGILNGIGDRICFGGQCTYSYDIYHRYFRIVRVGYPSPKQSVFENTSRNRSVGRYVDRDWHYYSKVHHDTFNIFDGNHTITVKFSRDPSSGTRTLFSHGTDADGITVQSTASTVSAIYGAATGSTTASLTGLSLDDFSSRVVQITRLSNNVQVCVSGSCSSNTDVTGKGTDASRTFYVGADNALAALHDGSIEYLKIDNEDTGSTQREKDLSILRGLPRGATFTRTSSAYRKHGDNILQLDGPNVVGAISSQNGIMIEPQSANNLTYSTNFSVTWTKVRSSVTRDPTESGPIPGQLTYIWSEDNTPASSHAIVHPAATVTNGVKYTYSVYAKPINRDWIVIQNQASPNAYVSFNVRNGKVGSATNATGSISLSTNGFYKCSMTYTTAATANSLQLSIGEADNDWSFDGLNQPSLYIQQAQAELGSIATSPIVTTTSAPVTRTADALSWTALKSNLPTMICPTCTAKKLHMSIDIKCPFETLSAPGENRYIFTLGSAASANNQVQFYISSSGRLYSLFNDSSGTTHSAYSGVDAVPLIDWVNLDMSFDTTDLSSHIFKINGSSAGVTYIGNTGTGTLDLTGLNAQFGSRIGGQVDGCYHRNLKLYVE